MCYEYYQYAMVYDCWCPLDRKQRKPVKVEYLSLDEVLLLYQPSKTLIILHYFTLCGTVRKKLWLCNSCLRRY